MLAVHRICAKIEKNVAEQFQLMMHSPQQTHCDDASPLDIRPSSQSTKVGVFSKHITMFTF